MRIENSTRNTVFGVAKNIIQLGLKFAVRTIFIKLLGEELLGLDSLFSAILQVLSLAELGFGSAIIYKMYKPVAENDRERVALLLAVYKKIYTVVGLSVLAAGLILTPFLKHLISGTPPENINIYVVFIIFLINTCSGYFFAYKRSLIYAYQRSDVESKIGALFFVALYAVQLVLVAVFKNYYLYISLSPFFNLAENIVISAVANKIFGKFVPKGKLPPQEKKELKKSMLSMIGHKIGGVVVYSTDNIIMSAFLGLAIVGRYNNYYMIISAVSSFIFILIRSITGSIGNSVAVESVEKNHKNFKDLTFMNFWILGFCTSCFIVLFQPFIKLWLGNSYMFEPLVVFLIVISFALNQSRNVINAYRETTGTFYNDRFKPFIEAGANLIISLILVQFIGIAGVILGTIVSTLFIAIPIESYVVNKHYFKKSSAKYLLTWLVYMLIISAVAALAYFISIFIPDHNIGFFLLKFAFAIIFPNLIFFLLSFYLPQFKYFLNVAKQLLFRKKKNQPQTDAAQPSENKNNDEPSETQSTEAQNSDIVGDILPDAELIETAIEQPPKIEASSPLPPPKK